MLHRRAAIRGAEENPRPSPSHGSTPASNVIRVRLDDERDAKLERYMRKHHMSRSNAVRTLLDKALAEI